jgi:hypothetical protein
MKTKF